MNSLALEKKYMICFYNKPFTFFLVTGFLFSVIQCSSAGDLSSKMDDFVQSMNLNINTTDPGVYKGQSARYFTLGGASSRAPISEAFHFVDVYSPKISAGCSGIDVYTGGFSVIDADQFIENLKNIGQNAQGLLYMLALGVASPLLKTGIEYMNTTANWFNKLNMDSCEAATKMVQGGLKLIKQDEAACTLTRTQKYGEDWSEAKEKCTTGGDRQSTMDEQKKPNETVDFARGNLTWYVLMQDDLFKDNLEYAQLVMNILGTIIVNANPNDSNDDAGNQTRMITPGLGDEGPSERFNNIYKILLEGSANVEGTLMIYQCDSNHFTNNPYDCEVMTSGLTEVEGAIQGMHPKVKNIISSISDKIYSDDLLTDEEKRLIASAEVPLFRYLSASAALLPRGSLHTNSLAFRYGKLLADDALLSSLSATIEKVLSITGVLPGGVSDGVKIGEFRKNVEEALTELNRLKEKNSWNIEQFLAFQQEVRLYEKALMSKLSSHMIDSVMWGQ
jgi:conjugative transfer pilus assembly protein TraH